MASFTIQFLTNRPGKHGRPRWYWQPSAALKRAGFKLVALGQDEAAAIDAARRLNDQVAQWKAGGQPVTPKGQAVPVAKFTPRGTVGDLIDKYRRERLPGLAANTQREYGSKLRLIETWAADAALTDITRARVQKFKDGLLQPPTKGAPPMLNRAAGTLRVLRTLFAFAEDADMIPPGSNPAVRSGIETPAPRHQVWSPDARAAVIAAALEPVTTGGQHFPPDHSLAVAITLGFAIGQRQADVLKLGQSQYVEIPRHKMLAHDWQQLAAMAEDGRVMGIRLRQGKTRRWVEVPVVGDTRAMIDASIARARTAGATTILIDERTDRPWTDKAGQGRFQRRLLDAKERAITAATKAGNTLLADELAELQFRDLRRTAVVFMGELGISDQGISAITGHKLETVKKILETYMPRTTAMAATAIAMSQARLVRPGQKAEAFNS